MLVACPQMALPQSNVPAVLRASWASQTASPIFLQSHHKHSLRVQQSEVGRGEKPPPPCYLSSLPWLGSHSLHTELFSSVTGSQLLLIHLQVTVDRRNRNQILFTFSWKPSFRSEGWGTPKWLFRLSVKLEMASCCQHPKVMSDSKEGLQKPGSRISKA